MMVACIDEPSTSNMKDKITSIFKIAFYNNEDIYEIYAKVIQESSIFGFLEIEQFVFGKNASLVVDPSEEKLKLEFKPVKRTYIPLNAIIRIDEVEKEGTAKMKKSKSSYGNIQSFPNATSASYHHPDLN